MIKNTFIYNPIRSDFIEKAIETLYRYTDMSESRVIVVDQTLNGLQLDMTKVHLVLRPHRNLGFSKAMNEGIIHALRWESEYITCANDDIEYMDSRWWDGILETFTNFPTALAVNPECPKIPLWGYGRPHGEYFDIIPHKDPFIPEDYDYLLKGDLRDQDLSHLPSTFPTQKSGVTDAIATWHTTFKREFFEKIGMWEERYYPGGGEDYDLNARAYRENYRMLGTTRSWVWHWWGQSKDLTTADALPAINELRWMKPHELWPAEKNGGQSMDPWGRWTDKKGVKHPMLRDSTIGVIEI